MKVWYGSRRSQRGIDDVAFRLIKDLVLSQPGDTRTLTDMVVFDVPRSGIMRPGPYERFQVELGTRGEFISVKAFIHQKTLAKYELRSPLNNTSFNGIEIEEEEMVFNNHLLRRDQAAFSDLFVLMDRVTHTVFCGGKRITYTFQRRWRYPYRVDDNTEWYLGDHDYQVFIEGEFGVNEAVDIVTLNLPFPYFGPHPHPFIMTYRCSE